MSRWTGCLEERDRLRAQATDVVRVADISTPTPPLNASSPRA